MKKFKLNKQRLNLRNLTTPLLALSLMAGCAGLFGGSVSAASVTNTVSLDAAHPSIPMSDFRNIMVAPTNSSDWSSYVIEAGSAAYFSMDSVANPCTVTPVDLSLSISITPSSNINGSMAAGMVIGIYDLATTNALSQSSMDLNGSSDNDFSTKSSTVSLSAATIQNIGFGIYSEGSTIGGESSQIHSFTYTLTYPDNMPDCTYPATNTPPTISPASTTIPSTTTSGSTVVPGSSLAATDTDGDTLTYSITAGNGGGYFAIDSTTGDITTTSTNIPAGTYTITVQVDDGNGGTATADVTITVTASTAPPLYCPAPYSTTTLLTPSGDCDGDGITNQTEGYDPDGDGNPNTGTVPVDTDSDGITDYLDLDTDNDGILDIEEKGTATNNSTNPIDTDSDETPDFRDTDSDNDSTTDLVESGRNNVDTNNDGRIDGTTNTYGIPSSAASTTNPKALASTSLKDSDNNGTPDYRQSSRNGAGVLAKTGDNLKAITIVSVMALGLAGYVKLKNKNSKSYRRR